MIEQQHSHELRPDSCIVAAGAVGSRVPLRASVEREQRSGLAGAERVRWLGLRESSSDAVDSSAAETAQKRHRTDASSASPGESRSGRTLAVTALRLTSMRTSGSARSLARTLQARASGNCRPRGGAVVSRARASTAIQIRPVQQRSCCAAYVGGAFLLLVRVLGRKRRQEVPGDRRGAYRLPGSGTAEAAELASP